MRYAIPDVRLVRADGKTVRIREVLDGPRPVILNFIFTTCGAICPVMSQTLAKVQDRLGEDRARVTMVSISIDPEQDTPERLTAYARKYAAGPQWSFYTGSPEASVALQKAFGMYRGNKMNHLPVTFVRTTQGGPWVRLEGLGNAEAIISEVRPALAVSDRRRP
jgi:protein SCO1/2